VTKAKEGIGKTTRIDTLRVELLRGQALTRLEADRERLASTQRNFAELLGFSPETMFELQPSPLFEIELPLPESALTTALDNRLDYAQAIQDYDGAERAVQIARWRLLPDVRVTASYDGFATVPTTFGAIPVNQHLFFLGVSSPIDFNVTRERIAVDQAMIAEQSALQAIEILKQSIARQVLQQLQAYRRAKTELNYANQNLELAAARAKLAKLQFELGRIDNFAVTDAEVAFLEAQSQLFTAQSEASIESYQLAHVLGTIVETPQDLKPGASDHLR
jgi:outer membrane protein TolC